MLHIRLTETANARDLSIQIWSMFSMIKDNITAATTYCQLQVCEGMVKQHILDRYAHMPYTSRILARLLRKRIQEKERAIFYDNINSNL